MEHKSIIISTIVLGLVIAGMFVFAFLKKQEINTQPEVIPSGTENTVNDPYANITTISAKHFFDGKTHTLVGEIIFPSPCDLLNWDTRIQESMPETAIVDFTVVNHAETCAQVATSQRFKVSFDASEEVTIKAKLLGRDVTLNLVPAGEGETPDSYELFIKG